MKTGSENRDNRVEPAKSIDPATKGCSIGAAQALRCDLADTGMERDGVQS